MDNLKAKYGKTSSQNLTGLPDPSATAPALIVKEKDAKKLLIPDDPTKVLALWGNRAPLPQVYSNPSQVTTIADGVVGRNKPVIVPGDVEEVMKTSRCDEG